MHLSLNLARTEVTIDCPPPQGNPSSLKGQGETGKGEEVPHWDGDGDRDEDWGTGTRSRTRLDLRLSVGLIPNASWAGHATL